MELLKNKTAKIVKNYSSITYTKEQLSNINTYFEKEMKIAVRSFAKKESASIIAAEKIILTR